MSAKSFFAGAATIALPVALVMGIMHFTHEYPASIRVEVPVPVAAKSALFFKHCPRPLPQAPAKRRHIDDGAP